MEEEPLIAQYETDAGRTEYVYRIDGKLRFSQNAKQHVAGTFSYIGYDAIGRPVETGECASGNSFFSSIRTSSYVEDISDGGSGLPGYYTRREIVRTTYDDINAPTGGPAPPAHNLIGFIPTFTAGRVATVVKYPSGLPYGGYQQPVSQSWYSYDEQGRLKWSIQRAAGKPARTLEYTYDFQGNVLTVCFQRNTPSERLTHYYTYDPNNRLSKVETGQDDPTIQLLPHIEQARYEYYLHGPIKRVVLGKDLQGVDYTYTAQGWLKSINDGDLRYDPGKDGVVNALLPDLFGATLQYYTNDYRSRTGGGMELEMGANRFDGSIGGQSWQTPQTAWGGYRYIYDSQGQLKSSEYGGFANFTARRYGFMQGNPRYQENNLDYDPNGNLKSMRRTDGVGWTSMDITYDYSGPNNYTNRLTAVKNAGQQNVISYTYDELGQMTGQQEQDPAKTKYLEYDVSGKVTAVFRDEAKAHPLARYTYDEFGHRLVQQIYPNDYQEQTTHYVRDLAGNEIATYYTTWDYTSDEQTTGLYEQLIYGATRLGTYRRAREQEPEQQLYELNDQLGNTRIVFRRPTTATYLLTMEDSRVKQEQQDFPDPAGTPIYDQTRSSNYAHPSPDGNSYSVKLSPFNPIGPAKRLTVDKGDIINLSVWAYYPGGIVMGPAPEMLLPMAVIGATTVTANPVPQPDGRSQTKSSQLLSRLSLGIALPLARSLYGESGSVPNAALQYVFKQPDGTFISNGTARVTSYSGGNWTQLQLSVTADQAGTIDISLNSFDPLSFEPGKDVYFDDLKIDHKVGPIVEENHFYAYGQRNEGLSWTRQALRSYERGYQGQYSKFDKETGYNSFELRMYDARVGRWMSTDPYRQYYSPYVGMGNNPVNSVDPDGGFNTYDIDVSTGKVTKVNDYGGDKTHFYRLIEPAEGGGMRLISDFVMNTNKLGFVQFPSSGTNWGRYGTHEKAGDNWINPVTAGRFLGLLHDLETVFPNEKIYYDDISAPDGSDIGHKSHRRGVDIDIRYMRAGNGPRSGSLPNCSTCWPTLLKQHGYGFKANNIAVLAGGAKWGFNNNFVYPKGLPNTIDAAHDVHVHHMHLGVKKESK